MQMTDIKAISGNTIKEISNQHALRPDDLVWLLGISSVQLNEFKKCKPNKVPSTQSLILRYLVKHPESMPIKANPVSVHDVLAAVKKYMPDFRDRKVSHLVGRELANNYLADSNYSPVVKMLLKLIYEQAASGKTAFMQFMEVFNEECIARGKDPEEVLKKGGWQLKEHELAAKSKKAPSLITGQHIKLLKRKAEHAKLKMQTLYALLGIGANQMSRLMKALEDIDNPIAAPYALLIRFYLQYPERLKSPYPEICPTAHEMYNIIMHYKPDFKMRQYGLFLGCEIGSSYRLLEQAGPDKTPVDNASSAIKRLLYLLNQEIEAANEKDRSTVIQDFIDNVNEECISRGINTKDFWTNGGWKNQTISSQIKERKLEAKARRKQVQAEKTSKLSSIQEEYDTLLKLGKSITPKERKKLILLKAKLTEASA